MIRTSRLLALLALLAIPACVPPPAALSPPATAGAARLCPDWSRASREDFSNRDASNFGCADALNFQAQLVDPRDARRGRGTSAGDGVAAANALDRMRSGRAQLPAGGDAPAAASAKAGPGA
jgi:type IV pilus biogenesis protein CpaD/CtpE